MLQKLFPSGRAAGTRAVRACRPRVEGLEDRVALSVTLSTVFSNPALGEQSGSLRASFGNALAVDSNGDVFYTYNYYTFTNGKFEPTGKAVVYELAKGSTKPKFMSSFSGTDGVPNDLLADGEGNIYGTTRSGGTHGDGTVFKIVPSKNLRITLAVFNNNLSGTSREGFWPGHLIVSGTTVYGTTYGGGSRGSGTVFSLPTSGGTPKTLAAFNRIDGQGPESLTLSGDELFGRTAAGGNHSRGVVFSLSTAGGSISVLNAFSASGAVGDVAVNHGSVFGADGGIYKIPAAGGARVTTVSFNGGNGAMPIGLKKDGPAIVGITASGGTTRHGTVFMLNADGTLISLASFTGGAGGGLPSFMTVGNDGNIYGLSQNNSQHLIFKVSGLPIHHP